MRTNGTVGEDKSSNQRLTVSLGPGQREALEVLARQNHAKLAFVVRYALQEFIERHGDGQLPLSFPAQWPAPETE